jgi:hypothetical protein
MNFKPLTCLLAISLSLALSACATVNTLPRSASEANFDPTIGGRTGWSEYEEVFMLYDTDVSKAFAAAKSGLADAGFSVKESSLDKRYAIGTHGLISYDWNLSAGVYLKELPKTACYAGIPCIAVKIQIEGQKDEGSWMWGKGARSWPQKIFDSMNKYVQGATKAPGTGK